MTHSKNHKSGFSFIEVVVAIFIAGLVISSVLTLSQTSMRSVSEYSQRLQRIFLLKKTIFDITFAQLNQTKLETNKAPSEDQTKISYRDIPIGGESSLKQFASTVNRYQVKAEWNRPLGGVPLTESLVFFKLKEPSAEKKS